MSESARYYKHLNGKTFKDICAITNYKQLWTVASQLEINRCKDYTVDVPWSMMIEKYKVVFARRNKETNVTAQTRKKQSAFPSVSGEKYGIDISVKNIEHMHVSVFI